MSDRESEPASHKGLEAAFYNEEIPLLARLDAARQIIRGLDRMRRELLAETSDLVRGQTLDQDTIAAIYWGYDDLIKTTDIGAFHEIRHIIEPRCPWTYPCPGCGTDLPVSSRTRLREVQSAFSDPKQHRWRAVPECEDCKRARHSAREEEWRARAQVHQQRLHELKTMRYRDYLLTPEWRERRLARLKAARYRCQVCNTRDVRLNVHHRTYVRRGEELARDLIVLCESCHHLFHQNGSLAPHSLEDEDEWFSPDQRPPTSAAREPQRQPGTCKFCQRPILWGVLYGRHRTFDPDPLPTGDVPSDSAFAYSAKHGAMVRADRMSPPPETVTRVHTCAEYSDAQGKAATQKEPA